MIKKSAIALIAMIVTLPIITQEQTKAASTGDTPGSRVLEMSAKWKQHDGLGVANLFTADGDIVLPGGRTARGHAAIQKLVEPATGVRKLPTSTTDIVSTRMVRPDVALVDYETHISSIEDKEGFPVKGMAVHGAAILVKEKSGWLIAAVRP